MKVGIYRPKKIPESFRVCVDNIVTGLQADDLSVHYFEDAATYDDNVDVIWDPRSGGGNPPHQPLLDLGKPVVVTVHGVAAMALPWEYNRGIKARLRNLAQNHRNKTAWKKLHAGVTAFVAVSEFGKRSIVKHLGLDADRIFVCENAVDHTVFTAGPTAQSTDGDYFLHLSNDEPRKNVDRIIAAYERLPRNGRWPLRLKLSGNRHFDKIEGVTVIRERLPDEAITALYQGASALVMPSLYEGFGLPALEAMAAGCPVITSRESACSEVTGDAAILVDPRSIGELATAMQRMQDDHVLRGTLVTKGLERAQHFSWHRCANQYRGVFEGAAAST